VLHTRLPTPDEDASCKNGTENAFESHMTISTNKEIEFRFVVRSADDWGVAQEMQQVLAKKYPVERAVLRMRNPHEPGFPVTATLVVYLVKEILGPTLRRMMKDGYVYLKKRMAENTKRKKALQKKLRASEKKAHLGRRR
jgi:hypothetical protein